MSNIFRRIYAGQLITSVIVIFVMSFFFLFGIRASISHWNTEQTANLERVLIPAISKVYRLNGYLDAAALEKALLPYLTDSLYAYVFDSNKDPVILLNRSERITVGQAEKQLGSMQTFLTLNPPKEIVYDRHTVGYLSVDSVDFLAYRANRTFIATMWKTVVAGIAAAVIATLLISHFISTFFSRQASSLVSGITELSSGKRSVRFAQSDMEEFNRISQSAESLQRQLDKEESLRRQWTEDISHDLRTPVTAVKVQLEAMSDGVLDSSKKRLENLFAEMVHIEKLVNNLQDLTRFESPKMKIQSGIIDAGIFIDDVQERFAFLAEQKRIAYECSIQGVQSFCADEHLLLRCVSNIIQNAIQYTASGGNITVTLKRDAGNVLIEVCNTGHLSQQDIDHMFDRMYRGDKARTEGGYGLGLSIAKAIMTLHGGTLTAGNRDDFVCLSMKFPFRDSI